jgi:hypothetical protein
MASRVFQFLFSDICIFTLSVWCLQMGFQPGKGLGKDLQGMAAPVEAHLRKGRGAIGMIN